MQVDAGSLQIRIDNLEMLKRHEIISLSGEYQLEAYKMLLKLLKDGARANCHCTCQFWHYDESRERCVCNSCLGVKAHD